jgi:hypothetical protein
VKNPAGKVLSGYGVSFTQSHSEIFERVPNVTMGRNSRILYHIFLLSHFPSVILSYLSSQVNLFSSHHTIKSVFGKAC